MVQVRWLGEDNCDEAAVVGGKAANLSRLLRRKSSRQFARCCASARSAEALAYRKKQGLSLEDVRIAVLVQHLVASDVSAVVFSANLLNRSRDEVVINASWGLGESIVGGTVTPDTTSCESPIR